MSLRNWFACSACSQKDALLGAQIKQLDNLLAVIKDAEAGRRGVEAALAAIAGDRAAQAAERGMGVAPSLSPPRGRIVDGPARRPLSPFMNTLYGGGHLDSRREDLRTVISAIDSLDPDEPPISEQE